MTPIRISRRALLAASGLSLACGTRRATGIVGYCFVANRDGRSVSVVDLSHFRVRKQIALDAAPGEVLTHPKSGKAYVLAPETATVYEIDALTLQISRKLRLGSGAGGMRLSHSGDALWVLTSEPAQLTEVRLDSLRPARHIVPTGVPDAFDLAVQTDDVLIASRRGRSITVASLATGQVTRTIPTAVEPSIACFRKDGKHIITGSEADRSLTIYDAATGRTVVRLPLSIAPRRFCTTEDGGQLYITGDGMDVVVTVYPTRTEIAETRLAGRAPGAMAVTETNPSYLLVANPQTGGVTAFDVDSGKFVAMVQVGKSPGSIVITPDKQFALVLNEGSGDLAVINILALSGNRGGGDRVKRYKSASLFTMIPVGERPVSAAVLTFS